MNRLVLSNSHIFEFGTFKDVLFNLTTALLDDKTIFSQGLPLTSSNSPPTDSLIAARLQNSGKKKIKNQTIFRYLSISKKSRKAPPKSLMPLPIAMKLIKSGKQKV